jgi:hypothetical protein
MTNDTAIAIIDTTQPTVAAAIGALPTKAQSDILTNGGTITLAVGKSPNGMECTLVADVTSKLTASVFAVAQDGRRQPIAASNVSKVIAMLA